MLRFQLPDLRPLQREGITCKLEAESIDVTNEPFELDFCFCGFECEDYLKVFSGVTEREKDFFTLYHKSLDESATVEFTINDIVLEDETHGETIPNGFTVDWTKIANTLGHGVYSLTTTINEFGAEKIRTVGEFRLMPFRLEDAHGTVKIKTIHNGDLESRYNFDCENVPFEIRLPAIFGNRTRVDEFEDFSNRNRDTEQIHDRWWYEYSLDFTMKNKALLDLLINQYLSGEIIEISDYQIFNHVTYDKLRVRLRETDIEEEQGTNYATYSIKFEDYNKDKIKHPKP